MNITVQLLHTDPVLLWRINASIGMLVLLLVALIFFYLWREARKKERYRHYAEMFHDLLVEVIICDGEEMVEEVLLQPGYRELLLKCATRPFARKVLNEELVKAHKSLSGGAAANIEWLYQHLLLDGDTLQLFRSKQWHIKAKAIQQLAQMQQRQHLSKIYRAANNRNFHVRMEAQLALVRLTGFEGLRFLNVTHYSITPWQQLCLLQELLEHGNVQEDRINTWLHSENESVVAFAIKLVQQYRINALGPALIRCARQPSITLQKLARAALRELEIEEEAEQELTFYLDAV